MWQITIEKRPHLAVIDDDHYAHAILACKSEEAQNMVLNRFLQSRGLPLYDPTNSSCTTVSSSIPASRYVSSSTTASSTTTTSCANSSSDIIRNQISANDGQDDTNNIYAGSGLERDYFNSMMGGH